MRRDGRWKIWSVIAKAWSLKKVVDYGGHGVDGNSEFEFIGGEFHNDCFDAIHSGVHNIYVEIAFHFRG